MPRNITEYWQGEHLRAFISNPAAYPARSKMPGFRDILDAADLDALLAYLRLMPSTKSAATTGRVISAFSD